MTHSAIMELADRIRLLNHRPAGNTGKRRGRPRIYEGGELISALLMLWETSGFAPPICRLPCPP